MFLSLLLFIDYVLSFVVKCSGLNVVGEGCRVRVLVSEFTVRSGARVKGFRCGACGLRCSV